MRWSRPPRAGKIRSPRGSSSMPPMRLPVWLVRKPTAAAAATARSRFSHRAVPKSRLGDRSTTTQVSSSRSAMVWRRNGDCMRAVTFQSMRRTSSPGW